MSIGMLAAAVDPGIHVTMDGNGSTAVKLFLLMTALSFASALLLSVTAFTRVVIVLSFLRQALGTPSLPPTQVLIALALAITGFIMAPTATRIYSDALEPLFAEKISTGEAMDRASGPIRQFLLHQTRQEDLALFYEVAAVERPTRSDTVPLSIAVPAFLVSELTTAFRMGLFLFIPLVLMDVLVSALLMALGMQMLPPTLVSLPLKIGVFLLADGWRLLVASLVRSFG